MIIKYFFKSRNGVKGEPYYTIIAKSPEMDAYVDALSGGDYIITFTTQDDRTVDIFSVRCTYSLNMTIKFKAEAVAMVIQHALDAIRLKNSYSKIQNITIADLIDETD